jgi:hypothetical protein
MYVYISNIMPERRGEYGLESPPLNNDDVFLDYNVRQLMDRNWWSYGEHLPNRMTDNQPV